MLLILLLCPGVSGQRIGLVLSGGGAKGLAHVGVIRALEENGIPIDYVAGTSMGAIISSLYAMGYSAQDMEDLLGSEAFKSWYTATVEGEYQFYYKSDRPTPAMANLHIGKDSVSSSLKIPLNVVSTTQMNLAFVELFAQATAQCGGNFDSLFVPFRCVASDVYNKRQLIRSGGDLGDAVRASMTFPFVFKPIELEGNLAYDGGIYNNFPTDVMQRDFNPDYIIGSVVASNPDKPSEYDLMSQLENMIMEKTDYSLPDSLGSILTFSMNDVNLMDFDRLQELEERGYRAAMRIMDSLKARIPRRVDLQEVQARRKAYKASLPELNFKIIHITGAKEDQQKYIKGEFRHDEGDIFTFEDLKKAYFRLLADHSISEVIPHAVYNSREGLFDLDLKVQLQQNFWLGAGGSLSTQNHNQLYLGLGYQRLDKYPKEIILDGQIGRIYDNGQIMARMDFPGRNPLTLRIIGSMSSWSYYQNENIFKHTDYTSQTQKTERFVKAMFSVPFLSTRKAEFSIGYGWLEDKYFQKDLPITTDTRPDKTRYRLLGGSVGFYGYTLDSKQFATSGYNETFLAQIFTGRERYVSNDTPILNQSHKKSWIQLMYKREDYRPLSRSFTLGWMAEAMYAAKNFSSNHLSTILAAPDFSPTAHSRMTFHEDFRANQFLAAGIKPIFILNDYFHVRGEFYGFLPIFPIRSDGLGGSYYGQAFHKFEYMGEVSLVAKLPFGSVSAYLNHYSSRKGDWNVGVTIGWQLFNYRFIE